MSAPTRVFIAYTEGGGGHRSVARALARQLESALGWHVVVVNPYRDMGAFVDLFRILTGLSVEDFYNRMLQHFVPTYVPWQAFYLYAFVIQVNKWIYGRRAVQRLTEFWTRERPDLVVSVMPWLNEYFAESLERACPDAPMVTVMTDYDECVRGMWADSPRQWLIASSAEAARRIVDRGQPGDRVAAVPGVIVSPAFHEEHDGSQQRRVLGLEADLPVGLVMYGSQGASRMVKLARVLNRLQRPLQLIFICGHHDAVTAAIEGMETRYRKVVRGFVDDVPRYMAAADFFIGKPGPSSIAESLACGLPMILDFDWRTMLQDRYNARWAEGRGVALLSRGLRDMPTRVAMLLDDYPGFRDAAQAAGAGNALHEVTAQLARWHAVANAVPTDGRKPDAETDPGRREPAQAGRAQAAAVPRGGGRDEGPRSRDHGAAGHAVDRRADPR